MQPYLALKAARVRAGLSQDAVAKLFDPPISRAAVTQWETPKGKGGTSPEQYRLPILAKAYGCSIDDLLNGPRGVAEPPSEYGLPEGMYFNVPLTDALGGLGNGRHNEQYHAVAGFYPLPESEIIKNGWRRDALIAAKGEGNSMETTIYDGDPVVVNTDLTKIESGNVYAIEDAHEGTRFKRLFKQSDGRIRLVSDNQNKMLYPDEFASVETGLRIIGKVVHRSGRI